MTVKELIMVLQSLPEDLPVMVNYSDIDEGHFQSLTSDK